MTASIETPPTPTSAGTSPSAEGKKMFAPSSKALNFRLPTPPPSDDLPPQPKKRKTRHQSLPLLNSAERADSAPPQDPEDAAKTGRTNGNDGRKKKARNAHAHAHTVVELQSIHGLGTGVFAKEGHTFRPSDVIFAEKPLLKARKSAGARELLEEVRTLDKQQLLLLLTFEANGTPTDRALESVFRSNAIPCVEDDDDDNEDDDEYDPPCAIFKYVSRINHSCSPNAGWFWDEKEERMLVVAYQVIAEGEQITAAYCAYDVLCKPSEERMDELETSHLFTCKCSTCYTSPWRLAESDDNRYRLHEILSRWEETDVLTLVRESDELRMEIDDALTHTKTEKLEAVKVHIYLTQFYMYAARADSEQALRAAYCALQSLANIRGRQAAERHWIARLVSMPSSWASWGVYSDDSE